MWEAVLNVVNFICNGLDQGYSGVAGLFLDFSKAFDIVDHDILLKKLLYYGVCGKELLLFKSYLTNRVQYVTISGEKSNSARVEHGVPQGSCLGPLLFSIYLNDLVNLNLAGRLYMFADDICLFYPYKNELVLKTAIERDVSFIFEFARINKLVLNASKTKLIRFRPNSYNVDSTFNVFVDGNIVNEVNEVKYLGVTLQSNLSWDSHICNVKSKIAPAIGILYKMKYVLDTKTKLMLYQALIQSHVNYLAIIYGYKNTNTLKTLQCMQNKALKTIYNLPLTHPTVSLYTDTCGTVLPVHALQQYQLLVCVYKTLNKIGYHMIEFSRNQTVFNTRNRHNLKVVRCRLEVTKQRIEYMGCFVYNNLPNDIKYVTCLSTFKRNLWKYLHDNLQMLLT